MKLRKLLRIARWEMTRGQGILNKENVAFALVVLVLTGGVLYFAGGAASNEDIYAVGIDSDNPYYPAVEEYPSLSAQPADDEAFKNGELDILITDRGLMAHDTEKGEAAVDDFQTAVKRYNYRLMALEEDDAAAFPVTVSVTYLPPQSIDGGGVPMAGTEDEADSSDEGNDSEDGDVDSGQAVDDSDSTEESSGAAADDSESSTAESTEDEGEGEESDDGSETGTGSKGTVSEDSPDAEESQQDMDTEGDGSLFSGNEQQSETEYNTPSSLTPPFPFESLILAFAFILPLNFIVQVYASSMIDERLKRRGELLLVSPVSKYDIIVGKTLPYFTLALLVCGAITYYIGGSTVTMLAVAPLIMAFLAAGFLAAMFSRSYKELTFVMLTASVLLTAYAFLPAIFTTVHPVSVISPLFVVVSDLRGETIQLAHFLISTMPLLLVGGLMFVLGSGVYTEEGLFTQRPVGMKALDALAAQVYSKKSFFLLGAISLPFIFAAELLILTGLVMFPEYLSVPLLLGLIALTEEIGKSLPVYAAFETERVERSMKTALVGGFLAGFGFFAAEKLTMVSQYTSLGEMELGEMLIGTTGLLGSTGSLVGIGLLVLWPFVHSLTTMVSAAGARYGRWHYMAGLLLATALHLAYNLTAVVLYA